MICDYETVSRSLYPFNKAKFEMRLCLQRETEKFESNEEDESFGNEKSAEEFLF